MTTTDLPPTPAPAPAAAAHAGPPTTAAASAAAGSHRVLVVSHRLPLDVSQADDEASAWNISTTEGSHLALHFGLESQKGLDVFWIGWPGVVVPPTQQDELRQRLLAERKCMPVYLDASVAHGHYHVYCKNVLWPLFHYVMETEGPQEGFADTSAWDVYKAVNEAFAAEVVRQYEPGNLIWVNDYHLMLVPGMVREALPYATIGFYLHAPFPSSEIFRCLPVRKELLEGVAGANMIGFQNYSYARHFLSTIQRVLGCEVYPTGFQMGERVVQVGIFPVGVNFDLIEERRRHPAVLEKIQYLRELYGDKLIVLGRDKMDYIRGLPHKLLAFERFLSDHPEWRDKVVLVQVAQTTPAVPGQEDRPARASTFATGRFAIADQRRLELQVAEIAGRINSQYGSLSFTPVQLVHSVDWAEMYALLSVADVCLVTSIRDGMNLTAHEFVVCQQEKMSPVILSEFTGTAGCFSSALLINPWNHQEVAAAIHDALTMSEAEKRSKHLPLLSYIRQHTAQYWCTSFLAELRECSRVGHREDGAQPLDKHAVVKAFQNSTCRLFLLDYDGTLTPIVQVPQLAIASPALIQALQGLSQTRQNHVFIVSGRDQLFLESAIGVHCPAVGLSAEHGTFLRMAHGGSEWLDMSADADVSWKPAIATIFDDFTDRTPGSFIEHKRRAITWHYRMADPQHGAAMAQECQAALETAIDNGSGAGAEILVGKKNLEVRARATNKGVVVQKLLERFGDADFIFCAGDDRTDEDMFKALLEHANGNHNGKRTIITCAVGATRPTDAMYYVEGPADIVSMLADMAALSDRPANSADDTTPSAHP